MPVFEKVARERALGVRMSETLLALRRPEWKPPDEGNNAYWHFAGKEGLRFM